MKVMQVPARVEVKLLDAVKKKMKRQGLKWQMLISALLRAYLNDTISISIEVE